MTPSGEKSCPAAPARRGPGAVRQREVPAPSLFPPLPSPSAASHWRGRRAARGGGGLFSAPHLPSPPPGPPLRSAAGAAPSRPGAEGGEPRRALLSERLWGRLKPVSLQQLWLLQRGEGLSLAKKTGPSDASPDEGVVEDLPLIDEKAVEQLTEGLISHYLPDLQRSKSALQELTQNQVVLLETLEQEISKFKECNSVLDINALFSEAKHYHNKLVNIRNEMMMLHEKTSKLKKRALKLQQKRQKEELEREQQREKELEREKQLTAKPARRT
ncbi:biogenesis of lysosome-related organelles complex 1 subunit 6 isoform 1-T1 [Morphnus guianensis]